MNIPKSQVAGLALVARLSEQEVDAVLKTLARLEMRGLADIVSSVAAALPSKKREEIEDIVRVIVSLSSLRADVGDLLPDFIAELTQSMGDSGYADLHLIATDAQEKFKTNITRVLSYGPLNIAAKTLYLRMDFEHVFCRARVITDARPIYGEDRTAKPEAALIIHTLALHYHQGDQLKEIHIAMTEEDVERLKSLLDRAQAKQASLASLLRDARLAVIAK